MPFFDASPIKQYTPPINEQPASKHKQLGTVSETSSKVGWRTSSVSLLCMTSLEWTFWTGKLPGPVWWLTICVRHVGKTLLFFGREGPPRKWGKKVSKHSDKNKRSSLNLQSQPPTWELDWNYPHCLQSNAWHSSWPVSYPPLHTGISRSAHPIMWASMAELCWSVNG